jgi:hypothetical protein
MKFSKEVKQQLLELQKRNIFLEGNLLKVIDCEGDSAFEEYVKHAIEKDRDARKRRLDITKQVQIQNKDLMDKEQRNQELMDELKETLTNIEDSKEQIEAQNTELLAWKDENEKMSASLQTALTEAQRAKEEAERAKNVAENDLDLAQKKSQFELIGTIVKVSLIVILSVGVVTTGMYIIAMFTDKDTQIISSTWSNMFGILLTNAFSIIGTIMGVKYASEKPKE